MTETTETTYDVDGYPAADFPSQRVVTVIDGLAAGETQGPVALTPAELAYVVRAHGRAGLTIQACDAEPAPTPTPTDARHYYVYAAPVDDRPLFARRIDSTPATEAAR